MTPVLVSSCIFFHRLHFLHFLIPMVRRIDQKPGPAPEVCKWKSTLEAVQNLCQVQRDRIILSCSGNMLVLGLGRAGQASPCPQPLQLWEMLFTLSWGLGTPHCGHKGLRAEGVESIPTVAVQEHLICLAYSLLYIVTEGNNSDL